MPVVVVAVAETGFKKKKKRKRKTRAPQTKKRKKESEKEEEAVGAADALSGWFATACAAGEHGPSFGVALKELLTPVSKA